MKPSKKAAEISKINNNLEYLKGEFNNKFAPCDRDGELEFERLVDFVEENQHSLELLIKTIRDMEKVK